MGDRKRIREWYREEEDERESRKKEAVETDCSKDAVKTITNIPDIQDRQQK